MFIAHIVFTIILNEPPRPTQNFFKHLPICFVAFPPYFFMWHIWMKINKWHQKWIKKINWNKHFLLPFSIQAIAIFDPIIHPPSQLNYFDIFCFYLFSIIIGQTPFLFVCCVEQWILLKIKYGWTQINHNCFVLLMTW